MAAVSTRLVRGLRHQTTRSCIRSTVRTLGTASSQTESYTDENQNLRLEPSQADKLTDIGIRKIFNSDHDIFRQNVRRFYREHAVPYHAQWEENQMCSREVWEKAGEQGLLGTWVPVEDGGVGGDFLSSAIVWEEQYYANCTGLGFSIHSELSMPYIVKYGTKEQKEKFIPNMAAGKWIGAVGMSEPAAGSDLQGIKTRAVKDGDDWILNGSKVFITNGYSADVVVAVAVTDPTAKRIKDGITLFILEAGMPGFKKGRILNKLGIKGNDTAELFFEDVRIPKENVLGEVNKGFSYLMKQLALERIAIAGWSVAHTEWMFEETREYVKQRKAFGKTLSALQTIQHKMAEMKTEICLARTFTDRCMERYNQGGCDMETAAMAKWWCSDLQNRVATECVQMHGGWGYMWEVPIARAYVDARPQAIYGGTNEIMKELISRNIFQK